MRGTPPYTDDSCYNYIQSITSVFYAILLTGSKKDSESATVNAVEEELHPTSDHVEVLTLLINTLELIQFK